jgi:hypothetical protein
MPTVSEDFQTILRSTAATYAEGLEFFQGKGMLNDTLHRIVAELERAGISFVVIGGIAVNQYGYRRFTEDIDLLMTKDGLETFRETLVGVGFRPAFSGATRAFRALPENVRVEILTTGDFPGDGKPKAVAFPDPTDVADVIDGIPILAFPKLIELKLASGMTAPHRLRDLADVQELIRLRSLTADFAERLDPSVRAKFLELQSAIAEAPPAEFDEFNRPDFITPQE